MKIGLCGTMSVGKTTLVNELQKLKEYYLNGIKYDFEKWKDIKQSGEGLPWYKQSGSTIKTARF